MDSSTLKRCSHCRQFWPLSRFHKNRREKDGYHKACKDCRAQSAHALWLREKPRIYARNLAWRRRNPARCAGYWQAYYLQMAVPLIAARILYRQTHLRQERLAARRRYALNPEPRIARDHRRRAQKWGSEAMTLTRDEWEFLKELYGYRCVYCGTRSKRLTQDHIVPLS